MFASGVPVILANYFLPSEHIASDDAEPVYGLRLALEVSGCISIYPRTGMMSAGAPINVY